MTNIDQNQKLLRQLNNIAKKQEQLLSGERTYTAQTQRRWQKTINQAFEATGTKQFSYLNKKTPEAQQRALTRSAKTLTKKVEQHIKAEPLREEIKQISAEKLKETKINARTQNHLANKGLMPERSDLSTMNAKQLNEIKKQLEEKTIEERAQEQVQHEAKDFIDRYFRGLYVDPSAKTHEPGMAERFNAIYEHIGSDYVKLKTLMDRALSASFKGGYEDTKEMLASNRDADINSIMKDRLSRLENELGEII